MTILREVLPPLTRRARDRSPDHSPGLGHRPTRAQWRGGDDDPAWARPALLVLLGATALLYLGDLSASGWGNSFYAAAAQAGSESWKAFFFGSSDAANSITVDKTPASLWVMGLSVRLFGLSSWSILAPQALMGVASVGLLAHTVRRATGSHAAGLLAGATLALTPVAVLMFRFDNPDALLVLLLVAATHATLRAVDAAQDPAGRPMRWLVLGGGLVGLGFLTKMLQAFLVLPGLALAYLLCAAAIPVGRRLLHLLAAFAAVLVSGGWWVAAVTLWPADARPWIGGSQDDSVLELTLGYNGLGRLTGDETGAVTAGGGAGGATGMWGSTGWGRLLDAENGGQAGWLLPASIALLLLGLGATWLLRGGARHRVRAALVAWGGWLVVTALVFSFMAGIFHAYYSVALAPAIAAVVAIGGWALWRAQHEGHAWASAGLAFATLLATLTAFRLLARSADFVPWLRYAVLVLGALAVVGWLLTGLARDWLDRAVVARAGAAVGLATAVAVLAGPAAYAVDTAATPHSGSIVTAGPSTGAMSGPGGRGGMGGTGPMPGGMPGTLPSGTTGGTTGAGPGGTTGGMPGGAGGLLDAGTPSTRVTSLLSQDADSYTWVAAAVGSQSAAGLQLATQDPVMAIGGFNGSDPSPTLAQFQRWVAQGEVHWFVGSGTGGGMGASMGGSSASSEISDWVASHFTARTVDGVTLYDLSSGATGSGR